MSFHPSFTSFPPSSFRLAFTSFAHSRLCPCFTLWCFSPSRWPLCFAISAVLGTRQLLYAIVGIRILKTGYTMVPRCVGGGLTRVQPCAFALCKFAPAPSSHNETGGIPPSRTSFHVDGCASSSECVVLFGPLRAILRRGIAKKMIRVVTAVQTLL